MGETPLLPITPPNPNNSVSTSGGQKRSARIEAYGECSAIMERVACMTSILSQDLWIVFTVNFVDTHPAIIARCCDITTVWREVKRTHPTLVLIEQLGRMR